MDQDEEAKYRPSNLAAPPPFSIMSSQQAPGLPASRSDAPTGHPTSVASDLMKVYESLTKSSTPHHVGDDSSRYHLQQQSHDGYHAPFNEQDKYYSNSDYYNTSYHGQTPWGYDGSNMTVPPIPEAAYAAMSGAPEHPGHRQLRKRPAYPSIKEDESSTSSKGSSKARRKKKGGKASDGRWSKRFIWPEELHRDFVSAIFDVGLKHSSPATVLEQMPKHEHVTTERIKSHLQKYRVHREKSKKEFMSSFEATLSKVNRQGVASLKSLGGGEVAAHLVYSTLSDQDGSMTTQEPAKEEAAPPPKSLQPQQGTLVLPRLTEEEKRSTIGASFGYLLGLFFSLKQQLMAERANKDSQGKSQPVAAVFDSFVSGNAQPSSSGQGGPYEVAKVAAPSTRSNLEENSLMKREMQNQMAFQTKIRALKQQELNKYRQTSSGSEQDYTSRPPTTDYPISTNPREAGESAKEKGYDEGQDRQGPGETAADADADDRNRGLSIGAADDFWNADVVDEQLFEFLMNN